MVRSPSLSVIVLLLSVCVSNLSATTWYIVDDGSGDAPTIQAGIDSASVGDTVMLANGAFYDSGNQELDFSGKAITVCSENGPGSCTICGQALVRLFIFHSGESNASVVDGVTIMNGTAEDGGGICIVNSSDPTIKNCVITGNAAESFGGGIYCWYSNPKIVNCIISDNSAQSEGGGICCFGGAPRITNCLITHNEAPVGAGVDCLQSGAYIINCTITDHGVGTAAVDCWNSPATIANCIVWGNTPAQIVEYGTYRPTVRYCDIEGGHAGDGNINIYPQFIDSDGSDNDPDTWDDNNYRLLYHSPCIDAGDDAAVPPDVFTDLDGNPRIVDGDGNGTALVDMGAYEFQYSTAIMLSSFIANGYQSHVELEWITVTEIDNAGFNLYRSINEDGPFPDCPSSRVNEKMIPAQGSEFRGATYSFIDENIRIGVIYYYWLEVIGLDGERDVEGSVSAAAGSSEGNKTHTPTAFGLSQNYPNPFNPTTTIMYNLHVDCHVELEIYNVLGRKISTLVDEFQDAGGKVASWDARDESGIEASSGVYFYRIKAGTFEMIKKMVLLR